MKIIINIFFIITLVESRLSSTAETAKNQHFSVIKSSMLYKHVQKCVAEKQEQNFSLLQEELSTSIDEFLMKLEKENLLSAFKKNLSICSTPQARQQAVFDMERYVLFLKIQRHLKQPRNATSKFYHFTSYKKS